MNPNTSLFVQSLHGVDYIIKDKLLPEKLLKMEFFSSPNMSTFYRGTCFCSCTTVALGYVPSP